MPHKTFSLQDTNHKFDQRNINNSDIPIKFLSTKKRSTTIVEKVIRKEIIRNQQKMKLQRRDK